MSNDRPDAATTLEVEVIRYEAMFPEVAESFLKKLRSQPGYGTEHERWRHVSNVLWFYGTADIGGTPPSGFKELLIKAMDRADASNMARFALGFPDVALAMWICKNRPGGTLALAEALAEAERLDTPAARKLTGTPFSATVTIAPFGGLPGVSVPRGTEEIRKGQEWAEEPCEDETPHDSHVHEVNNVKYRCPGQ